MKPENKMLDHIVRCAKECMTETGHHVPQVMFEHGMTTAPDGKEVCALGIMLCPFENDKEKEKILMAIKVLVKKTGCKRYWHISEAWMAKADPKKNPMPYIRPSRCVNREECIIICEFNSDMNATMIILPFTRVGKRINADGKEMDKFHFKPKRVITRMEEGEEDE